MIKFWEFIFILNFQESKSQAGRSIKGQVNTSGVLVILLVFWQLLHTFFSPEI